MKKILGLAVFGFAAALACTGTASATISYHISLKNPEQHLFRVRMTIPEAAQGTSVAIPAWNALYQVRDFSYRVRDVKATAVGDADASAPISLQKLDKQTWQLDPATAAGKSIDVTYSIEWDDPGPFNSQLNEHHAFVNFAEVLMYLPERRAEAVEVKFDDVPSGWELAAQLPQGGDASTFTAASWDALVDGPVEIGKFEQMHFEEGGARFRLIVDGKDVRKDRLATYLKQITAYEIKLMGGAPFAEYTFFVHVGSYPEVGGGGMEHANCTAISGSSADGVGATAAHEFFHAWNVKRIRPQALEPVDFTKEQYTRALWFAEGVTSTYSSYALERTGLWSKEQFYGDLAGQIGEFESRPAHTWQSVEESSLDAWLEKYDDYRTAERSISYYNKGQIVGDMLDLAIRDASDGHKSLDDVMRGMNEQYAKQGKFYNDSGAVKAVAEEVAGAKFDEFFGDYVAGTKEISYDSFLNAAGLALKIEMKETADLGFWTVGRGPGVPVVVSQIEPGSAAQAAGLQPRDILLTLNGGALPRYFPAWLHDQKPGEKITLRVHRDDKELEIAFNLGANEEKKYSIVELPSPSERQKRIRQGWLAGKTE